MQPKGNFETNIWPVIKNQKQVMQALAFHALRRSAAKQLLHEFQMVTVPSLIPGMPPEQKQIRINVQHTNKAANARRAENKHFGRRQAIRLRKIRQANARLLRQQAE